MSRSVFPRLLGGLALVAVLTLAPNPGTAGKLPPPKPVPEQPPSGSKVVPKLEPIAETKLIMDGIAHANYRGLEKLLAQQPADAQAWTFARGQALLLAETGNLLMLRPPN